MNTKAPARKSARFLNGALMPHIIKMTLSASIGLISLFLVDVADLYFLSILEDESILAALGFASTIIFFSISINIGFMIAVVALVSKAVGEGDHAGAKRLNMNGMFIAFACNCVMASMIWVFCPALLKALGAEGVAITYATSYMRILVISLPVLALGMCASGALRAVGDARQSMYSMLAASIVNAALDPLFIFTFNMGIEGAALASALSRFVIVGIAFYGLYKNHDLIGKYSIASLKPDLKPVLQIAIPAIATNLATPIGTAFVYNRMAQFGESAIAGLSMVMRVETVAFAIIYSLSGAIGPIIGQNFGAQQFDRITQALHEGLKFILIYVLLMGVVLFFSDHLVIGFFRASDEAAMLISHFGTWLAWAYIFNGCLFVAMAAFNNLGQAKMATVMNWGKATIGLIPFVYLGGQYFGAKGVLCGQFIASVFFGLFALYLAHRRIDMIRQRSGKAGA